MKLLLIDHLSPSGHKRFDSIHISAFLSLGYEIDVLCKHQDFLINKYSDRINVIKFPSWLFKEAPIRPLTERIFGLLRTIWLEFFLKRNKYDAIIFLSYDVLSLFILRVKGNVYLVNHNNISQIDNSKIKLYLTSRLPSNFTHIALSKTMKNRIIELLPGKRVEYVPHGYSNNIDAISCPDFVKSNQKFLFCPVNSNYDVSLLRNILDSQDVRNALINVNITLFVKNNIDFHDDCISIRRISSYLTPEEYNYMLDKAIAVVLPYGKEFKYRCSGIFFECIAKDKVILSTDIPDMIAYSENAKICFFSDAASFVKCINQIDETNSFRVFKDKYCPTNYWKSVLEREVNN